MSVDNTIDAYIIDTQMEVFNDARSKLQLPLKKIAGESGIPYPTIVAYSQGRHALSLCAIKKLLQVRKGIMAPLLSRLFEPEEFQFAPVLAEVNHEAVAEACLDFLGEKSAAHHPASEAGPAIGPKESKRLRAKAARLKVVG